MQPSLSPVIASVGTEIGATFQVTDVLGFHSLTAHGGYTTAFHKPVGSVAYGFNQLLPNFAVGFGRAYARRNGFSRYNYDSPAGESGYRVTGYREWEQLWLRTGP